MTPGDYAPPATPTAAQQQDALRKGLGRAVQWAAAGVLDGGVLLAACLSDQRYDRQADAGRADWLWGMVTETGATDRLRGPLLDALRETPDGRSVDQLCGLARHYAEAGDGDFRTRLYELVGRKPVPDSPWLGEGELIALDGEAGFLFAAGVRGRILADDPTAWDDGDLIRAVTDRFGEARVEELLATSADNGVRRYAANWAAVRARQEVTSATPTVMPKASALGVADVLREATTDRGGYLLRRWGRQARPADLRTVLGHLGDAVEPRRLSNLLTVFGDRPLPEFDARLFDSCRHADEEVRRRAFEALAQNAHPRVRAFALNQLAGGTSDHAVLSLFARNFERGDEQQLLGALPTGEDADELHGALMSLLEVAEGNPDADAGSLGVVAYARTPCGHCRRQAVILLHRRGVTPGWLREECRHDAEGDCRAASGG